LDAILSTFTQLPRTFKYNRSRLYTLNDTFIVDFSGVMLNFFVVTKKGMERSRFTLPFCESRLGIRTHPYTGRALARFERSTLPHHEGTRTLVLRYLKIITPVKCVIPHNDGYIIQPEEGELHRTRSIRKTDVELDRLVWSINIDKPKGHMSQGLRFLWDATDILL